MEITLEYFLYFNISFFVRMIILFTVMMKYFHWVDQEGMLWKITQYPWKLIAGLFFLADIIYNWYSTLTFLDKPATWDETVSWRMDRYIAKYKDNRPKLIHKWRYYFAIGTCTVLSWSDPKHCGKI